MSALNPPEFSWDPETMLEEVRRQVHALLESSPAFNELDDEDRRQTSDGMVKVVAYMSNPDGLFTPDFPSAGVRPVGDRAGDLIDQVDFPQFVSGLIQGVFQAIVDSSIRQMEAFADLVAEVSRTVDQFLRDTTSEDDARDWLARSYPAEITLLPPHRKLDLSRGSPKAGIPPKLTVTAADPRGFIRKVSADLHLPQPVTDINDEIQLRRLFQAARRQIAVSRREQLASTLKMGINRIIVTDG